ncbi:FAD-dependent oxidoreductase [Allostreptomyces psammosilenae]|uniref:2-polyprenyl-6-methoxyphenol hydroxylase-like FAD-dependent oxidoreductase n=1 Tax=Allostreptomyces psammosilenae TaxID=1892865 RepID=A0A852ZVE4_9ACTN|nr:FAD-dependent oxidoreductase [Allostreptomyces psammosilenae]NYI04754.1 2-polyprenyl-6-methoxyphenol hydroxylase-like FAD-dependent oxidoreductase [Allostreptomyces psammosilenae]
MTETGATTCAISGGGPAGMMLGLLLARAGIDVTVLEKHGDFLRDFRGDTVHPSTLQVLDELGMVDALERIPHSKLATLRILADGRELIDADLRRVPGRWKYRHVAMVPQWDFLTLLVEHARRHPGFHLLMEAESVGLIEEHGAVRGLRYRDRTGEHELRAVLTVAADGRHSDLRSAAGLVPRELGAPMDVLWLRISRRPEDGEGLLGHVGPGSMVAAIDRHDYWQIAFLIPKGTWGTVRAQGLERFRERLARLLPALTDRIGEIDTWERVKFLEVGVNRLSSWDRPGFLAIGDAAHTMSPVAGVGINLAVQDAVATANLLADPLYRAQADPDRFRRTLNPRLVQRVRRRRRFPTAGTQTVQVLVQRQLIGRVLGDSEPPRVPAFLGNAALRRALSQAMMRIMWYGILPEHVHTPERPAPATTGWPATP